MTTHRGIRTSVEIPERLWTAARTRAIEDRTNLRAMILEGLEWRLGQKSRRPAPKK